MTATPRWMTSAATLATYVRTTGRLPRQSGAASEEEQRAGTLLRRYRQLLNAGQMKPELEAWLHESVPGWKDDNTRREARGMRGTRVFEARVRAVARFAKHWGRLPSASGATQNEKALGVFLRNQRQAAKGKGTASWTLAKRVRLDQMVPGWDLGTLNTSPSVTTEAAVAL